eukprot:15050786-Alexandrium_andersonii.AAC.1
MVVYQALQAVGVALPPPPAGGLATLLPGLASPQGKKAKQKDKKPKKAKADKGKDSKRAQDSGAGKSGAKGGGRDAQPSSGKPAPWTK